MYYDLNGVEWIVQYLYFPCNIKDTSTRLLRISLCQHHCLIYNLAWQNSSNLKPFFHETYSCYLKQINVYSTFECCTWAWVTAECIQDKIIPSIYDYFTHAWPVISNLVIDSYTWFKCYTMFSILSQIHYVFIIYQHCQHFHWPTFVLPELIMSIFYTPDHAFVSQYTSL